MKNKTAIGILLALLLTSITTLAFNVQPVKSDYTWTETIYIRADGSVEPSDAPISTVDNVTYTLIDNIVDAAPSDYDRAIVVGRDNIVIDGDGHLLQGTGDRGTGIDLTGRSNVTIKNTKLSAFYYGVYLNYSSNNTVCGYNITNNSYGIYLDYSSNNTISENNMTANFCGVWLHMSSHNTLSENNITAITASDFYGIFLDYSSNNTLIGNTITKHSDVGIWLSFSSYNVLAGNRMSDNSKNFAVDFGYINYVDNSNTVDGKPIYYWISEKNRAIPFDAGCVILVYCEGIRVQNLTLTRNTRGIQLIYTKNSTISKNNITNCHDGIKLDTSSIYNNITENNITSNRNGLFISYLSKYNVISKNRITANYNGIIFSESSDNKIYHNNFIDNAEQAYSYATINVWNGGYPTGGNFWSGYNGTDLYWGSGQNETGSDALGDTPYVIDEDNIDGYPLMAPFTTFDAGTWNGVAYNVDVISNSTISDFHFNPEEGAFLRFNVTGEDDTSGFCRVTIPIDLLWVDDGWTITVGDQPITDYTLIPDGNFTYLYFTYNHSTQTVTIEGTHAIPEFSSALILPLLMILSAVALVFAKKKTRKKLKI